MADRSAPQFFVRVFREGVKTSERVGIDVDAKILTLTFEDGEMMHKLKLTVDNSNLDHFDSPTFATGNTLEFSYGYPGNMSRPREAVITKVTGGTTLSVEALGKEYLMNKVLRVRSFENVTRSGVAEKIAEENGYTGALQDIDQTFVVFPVILQARQTDYGLLRALAQKEGFETYIDATGFHFHRRRLGQKPKRTFTYYTDKTGDLLAFPSVEIDVTAKPGAVTAVGRDPLKKTDISERADNTSTKGRPALGSVLEVVDKETAQTSLQTIKATETTTATTATNAEDAKRQASGAYQKGQMAAVKFKVSAIGDPRVEAKTVGTFVGLGQRLNGNHFVSQVTHKLGAGYTMDLECRRDGSGLGTGAGEVPKTTGKTNTEKASDNPLDFYKMDAVEVVDKETAQTKVEYR